MAHAPCARSSRDARQGSSIAQCRAPQVPLSPYFATHGSIFATHRPISARRHPQRLVEHIPFPPPISLLFTSPIHHLVPCSRHISLQHLISCTTQYHHATTGCAVLALPRGASRLRRVGDVASRHNMNRRTNVTTVRRPNETVDGTIIYTSQ